VTAPPRPFVSQLRTRGDAIMMTNGESGDALTIRVQLPEVWETLTIVASPSEPVVTVKQRALAKLYPQAQSHESFILKLRGWEVLDEHATLRDAGATNGSIFLLTHRRRRAVK
jgi:hypothetical protein